MSDAEYVGAIDQGTTGTRFVVFDREARVVASAYETHEQHYPRPGWVEHDPEEIWANVEQVVEDSLAAAGLSGDDLAAVGVTNQRETTVLWDRETGDPVYNAVVWQDRRTTDRVEALEADGRVEAIRATTGLEPDAYFSATKLEWLLDHGGGESGDGGTERGDGEGDRYGRNDAGDGDATLRERAGAGELCFGTIDSWLIYRLTGAHCTDVTNASRTMLFDVHVCEWDDDLLAEFDVPRAVLPEVRPSIDEDCYGRTDPDGVFDVAVPVAGALGDQQAALFGQACFEPGEAKNTYGTGSFVLAATGTEPVASDHGLLTTIAYQRSGEPARYALEGSIFATGAAIEWLVDVGLLQEPADVEALARSVEGTDGVYLVPAFAGLGAPHWDGRARGTIVGLTRGTRREHLARATLEAIAFQTRDVLAAMEADAGLSIDRLKVDGGAVDNDLLCALQADVAGATVDRAAVRETTALGAAFAAGLAVGVWDDLAELRSLWRADRTFESDPADDVDARYERWGEAVDRARGWATEEAG